MLQNVFDRVLTGVTKRAAEVQAAASKQGQESLHTQAFANKAHAAGECKTRTAQKAHVESAKVHAQRLIDSGGEQTEIMKRDVLGNLLTVVQDSQHPGDWAIRACLNYMNSPNSMTKGLALLTHAKLLDLMPPEKRSSELLAAVQTVATSLRSMDEIEVQYALKYISSCWDADLVPNIIGQPGQPRKTGGSSAPENITLLSILLPDMSEARKPALASSTTIKHTLAAFTSLVQRFREQVESCIDLLDVTNSICKRHMSHGVLGLPTANLLRVVVSRCAAKGQLAAASDAFLNTTVTALEAARSCTPLPHYKMQALAGALSTLCVDSVSHQAANALGSAMDAAMAHTGLSDDHEMASAYGTLSQCVMAVSKLPPGAPRVPDLHKKAIDVTRHMFNRAKSTKPSQWRNPNNLHFEALRCIVALQACKPSVATPFREEIVHCLRSTDASLRYLAADVLYNSCSADNLSSVAEQFLLIIRSSSEDSIRASYSTKVAQLVETYAQPAEYARTMAAVLVAAGNAAPKALASRISGTLALCGEQTVQANTASVFSQLLKAEDPLSDAQLLVAFWVVAEYGESAGISSVDSARSIIRVCTRQRLSHEQEAAALTALFKIAAKAGASAGALQTPLAGFLKAREASMDIMVARLASFTSSAIRQPGAFMKVITPADQVSAINQQSDVDLSNLAALAAEQSAQGQAGYTEPDDRFGLFTPAMVAPAQPSLKTEQYASPSTSPALPGVGASPSLHSAAAMNSSASPSPQQAARAARPPPRAKPSRGTFSNMMMGPDPAAAQPPAAAPAAASASTPPPAAVPRYSTPTPEKDSLADMLFGGSGGGVSPLVNTAKSSPPPAPATDLLGDFGLDSVSPAPAAVVADFAGGGGFADLLGGEAASPAAGNDDPLAALSGLSIRETQPAAVPDGNDPFANFPAVAAPGLGIGAGHAVDLASDLDMLSDPMPVVSAAAVGGAQPPVDPLQSLLGAGSPESVHASAAPVTSNYAVPPPLPVGPVPYRQNAGVPGWPMAPDASAGAALSGEQDSGASTMPQDISKPQGTLPATAPKKKGDAFADLLGM